MRPSLNIGLCLVATMSLANSCLGQFSDATPAIHADTPDPQMIVEKADASVVMVLVSAAPGQPAGAGPGLVVRGDGVLLTSYRLVKDAAAVQVRFKSGETFDQVQLLGVDERRDVAALRIAASGLPVLVVTGAGALTAGDTVVSIAHPADTPWSPSMGEIAAYRFADEIPGAGFGFRLIEFTAPAAAGSSGAVLLDAQGRALGLVTGQLNGGHHLNYAVALESVLGLADAPPARTFASGAALVPPHAALPAAAPQQQADEHPTSDREALLRSFKTMYVDCKAATFMSTPQLIAALARTKDFAALHLTIVDDPKAADTVLVVGYSFAWDYPFALKHQQSSMLLLAGKGIGPFSGLAGAINVAKEFVKAAKPYRVAVPTP